MYFNISAASLLCCKIGSLLGWCLRISTADERRISDLFLFLSNWDFFSQVFQFLSFLLGSCSPIYTFLCMQRNCSEVLCKYRGLSTHSSTKSEECHSKLLHSFVSKQLWVSSYQITEINCFYTARPWHCNIYMYSSCYQGELSHCLQWSHSST